MVDFNKGGKEKKRFLSKWSGSGTNDVKIKFLDSWAGTLFSKLMPIPKENRYPCEEPWKRVAVLWNGDVVPCCRDWNGFYVYGNLHNNSLREIWEGEKVKELRRQMLKNAYKCLPCKTCKEWNIPMNRLIVNKDHK